MWGNVCTWIANAGNDSTVGKIYNKIVTNFEARDVCERVGGHLADYVDCPNKHLRRTFLHPDVEARGCTRIEVSFCPSPRDELSGEKADEVVQKALAQISPEGEEQHLPAPSSGSISSPPRTKGWNSGFSASTPRKPTRAQSCPPAEDRPSSTKTRWTKCRRMAEESLGQTRSRANFQRASEVFFWLERALKIRKKGLWMKWYLPTSGITTCFYLRKLLFSKFLKVFLMNDAI